MIIQARTRLLACSLDRHAEARRLLRAARRRVAAYSTLAESGDDKFSVDKAVQYCRQSVQSSDYEGYLAALILPTDVQPAAWALRAFNVELASVKDAVRDSTLGRMRFMFWRETLDRIQQGSPPPQQPVAVALAYAAQKHKLSVGKLRRIITAREENLVTTQYATVEALEQYAEGTASQLLYLHLDALGVQSLQADHTASHIGKAIGIVTALRGVPFLLRKHAFHLPADVCAKHGVVSEHILRHGPTEELASAVFELATRANDQIATARSHWGDVPDSAKIALAPAVSCARWLQKLEQCNFDLFNGQLHQRDPWLPMRLWQYKWTQRI
ncbi:hypothetical protein RI367_002535 [Sorochytrium milnesiophthora]